MPFKLINQRHLYLGALVGIVLVGSWLRLYKFDLHFTWSADQTRDVLVAKKIVTDKTLYWIAPSTSDSSSLLKNSPVYFYVIALFWTLFPSPVGVTFCFIVLGIVTIILAYLVGQEIASKEAGIISSIIVSIHPFFVGQSWIWQPHLISFFTSLSLLFLLKGLKGNKKYLFISTVIIFIGLHIHYSVLPLIPVFISICLLQLLHDIALLRSKKLKINNWYYFINYSSLVILLGAVWLFLTSKDEPETFLSFSSLVVSSLDISNLIQNSVSYLSIIFDVIFIYNKFHLMWLTYLCLVAALSYWGWAKYKQGKSYKEVLVLLALSISFLFTTLYNSPKIFNYHFTPFFLIFGVSFAVLLSALPSKISYLKWAFILILSRHALLFSYNIQVVWAQNYYGLFEHIAQVVYADMYPTTEFDTVFYVYTSSSTDYPMWDAAIIWNALEELTGRSLVTIVPYQNNIRPPVLKSRKGYLVCTHIFESSSDFLPICQDRFKDFLITYGINPKNMTFSLIKDAYPSHLIYRINSTVDLPAL